MSLPNPGSRSDPRSELSYMETPGFLVVSFSLQRKDLPGHGRGSEAPLPDKLVFSTKTDVGDGRFELPTSTV